MCEQQRNKVNDHKQAAESLWKTEKCKQKVKKVFYKMNKKQKIMHIK